MEGGGCGLRDVTETLRSDRDGVAGRLAARTRLDLKAAEENRERMQKIRHVDRHWDAGKMRAGE